MKKLSLGLITVSFIAVTLFGATQIENTASKNDVRGNSIELTQVAKNEVR